MALEFLAAKDQQPYLKALIYGPVGSGKTTFARSAPRPVFAITEKIAIPTIVKGNPEAKIVIIKSSDDLRELLELLREGKHEFDSVVLDSLSDMFQLVRREQLAKKQGKDVMSERDWGVAIDTVSAIARSFRDLDMHVCVTCHSGGEHAEGKMGIRPLLAGKTLPYVIGGYFIVCGYAMKKSVEISEESPLGLRFGVLTASGDDHVSKSHEAFAPIETGGFGDWVVKFERHMRGE